VITVTPFVVLRTAPRCHGWSTVLTGLDPGIGPKRALELIRKHGSIEGALKNLDKTKYPLPEDFPYEAVRELFKNPDVAPADDIDLKWTDPDEDGLIEYLVKEKQFNEERVRKGIEKLKKA